MMLQQRWRAEVEQAINEMFELTDTGRADGCVAYVTDDFTMEVAGREIGRARYAELMDERTRATYSTRHRATNLRLISRHGDDTEDVVTVGYIVSAHRFEDDETTTMVGDFTDVWTRRGDRWELRHRTLALALTPTTG